MPRIWAALVLAVVLAGAFLLADQMHISDSEEGLLALMGALWVGVLVMKGTGRE